MRISRLRIPGAFVGLALLSSMVSVPTLAKEPTRLQAVKTLLIARPIEPDQPDPGRFLYSYDFPLKWNGQAPTLKGAAKDAFKELHRCFNCSFPITGAPATYPKNGQHLPLKACGLPGCPDAPVKAYSHEDQGYLQFVAEPGHFDGAGSTVTFRFSRDAQGNLNLNVTAYVTTTTTNATINDDLNKYFAHEAWGDFARELALNIEIYDCPTGVCH